MKLSLDISLGEGNLCSVICTKRLSLKQYSSLMSRCKWHYLLMVVLKVSLISRKRHNVLSALAKEQWNVLACAPEEPGLRWRLPQAVVCGCGRLMCCVLATLGYKVPGSSHPVIIPTEQAGSRSSGRLWLRGLETRGGRASLQADWEAALTDRRI